MDKLDQLKKHMKGMSFREGFDYLWTYYRLPFFVTVFCLICLICLTSALIKGKLSHPVLSVAVTEQLDLFYGSDLDQLLKETFPENTGFTAPERSSVSSPENASNPYGPIQLTAYLSAGTFDVLICDQATLDYITGGSLKLKQIDITATALGSQAAAMELSPLYYVILTDSSHTEAAEKFLCALQEQFITACPRDEAFLAGKLTSIPFDFHTACEQ